jgi:hypothetical protein
MGALRRIAEEKDIAEDAGVAEVRREKLKMGLNQIFLMTCRMLRQGPSARPTA